MTKAWLKSRFHRDFPLTSRLKRERELSEVDLALAKAEVRVAEWNLAAEVREAAVDALAYQRRIQLRRDLRGVLTDLSRQLEEAFQVAEASSLDVTEAKLEVEVQSRAIQQLEAELSIVYGRLRGLMGIPASSRVEVAGQLFTPANQQVQPNPEILAKRP